MFGWLFGSQREEETEDEFLQSLEEAPEASAFANWLLENPDAPIPGDAEYEPEEPRHKFLGLF